MYYLYKNEYRSQVPGLMSVILAIQEEEIRKITFKASPGHKACETLSQKTSSQKRAGRVTQAVRAPA
jgi:hypothetical protein